MGNIFNSDFRDFLKADKRIHQGLAGRSSSCLRKIFQDYR